MASIEDVLREVAPACLSGATVSATLVMVRCPFHGGGQERTPSCSLSRTKPVFFCHACSEGGNIARFLRAVGVGAELAKKIPAKINYEYTDYSGQRQHKLFTGLNPYRGKFVLDDDILDSWRLRPQKLIDDGFKEVTLRHFEVGYDRTTCRITFPLRNVFGELVGVSGRTTLEEAGGPRYKIYSAKDLAEFNVPADYTTQEIKGALLWHGHLTFPIAFEKRTPIIITEGFKAAMWVWQCGFQDVVALVGAHLTKLQAELLARTASEVILFLDNNSAGWKGTAKAGHLLINKNIVKVAHYPDLRQQPDNLSESEIQAAITNTDYFSKWQLQHRVRERNAT